MTDSDETRQLLQNIEQELKRLDLWEGNPPPADALASETPFCYDTLKIHQWLQWIFIPRIQALIDAGRSLPEQCDIASYAEIMYEKNSEDKDKLIQHIRAFDRYCSKDT